MFKKNKKIIIFSGLFLAAVLLLDIKIIFFQKII